MSFEERVEQQFDESVDGDPALIRKGLDWLLAQHPGEGVVQLDGQPAHRLGMAGPWVCVDFPSAKYAIWKVTGAVYEVGASGAVPDDPVFAP